MRVLLVYCHPCPDSFASALCEAAIKALSSRGHDVEVRRLYAEEFDPALNDEARRRYYDESFQDEVVADHIASLQRAEALIFIYPTWWFGPPAMLKGWFDRVWLPGVAFRLGGSKVLQPMLTHIERITVITTYGSPRWLLWMMGWPDWRIFKQGIGKLCAPRCRLDWIALTNMDSNSARDRERFIDLVRRRLSNWE